MKQLNNWQNAIFIVGSLLMLAGPVLSILKWMYFPYIYAIGAICYVSMQMLQRYEGSNLTIRRLRRIMLLSDILLLFVAVLMFASQGNALGLDWIYYLNYVHNNWIVVLLIAAALQLYTSFRIGSELEKEAKKL
jgi:hypothetical protein